MLKIAPFPLVLCALMPPALQAKPLAFDATSSKLTLNAKKLGFSNINATFTRFNGALTVAPDENMHITVDAVAKDFGTGSRMQDDMFRGKDWLNVKAHPRITFASKGFTYTAPKKAVMTGNMTVKGITKPVTFEVDVKQIKKDAAGKITQVALLAKTNIKRSDFGMTAMRGVVNNNAGITLAIQAGL